jgi:hypothetical protein
MVVFLGIPIVSTGTCAPLSVQHDFNVTEYLRSSWYVQKQQKNGYQPEVPPPLKPGAYDSRQSNEELMTAATRTMSL